MLLMNVQSLTIPTLLMRNEGDALYNSFQTPWQSVGAKESQP